MSYLAIPSTEQTHADNFLVLRQLMHCCVLPKLNSAADDESVPVRLLLLFRDSGACMAPEIDLDIRHLAQYYGEIVSLVEHEWQILRFDPLIVPPSSCVRDSDGNDDDDAHFYLKQWEGCSAAHTELVLFSDSDKAEETAFCDDDDKYSHVERLKRESAEDYASYLEEIREVYPYYHHRHDHLIFERYGNVVLGGTFDRIHLGHKVMLSQLVMATKPSGTVHIGISGEPLLKNKKYREMIHPIEMRMDSVRRLIAVLKPCVNVNVRDHSIAVYRTNERLLTTTLLQRSSELTNQWDLQRLTAF